MRNSYSETATSTACLGFSAMRQPAQSHTLQFQKFEKKQCWGHITPVKSALLCSCSSRHGLWLQTRLHYSIPTSLSSILKPATTLAADRVRREKDLWRAALPSLPPSVHIIFDLTGSPIWLSSISRRCRSSSPTAKAKLPCMTAAVLARTLGFRNGLSALSPFLSAQLLFCRRADGLPVFNVRLTQVNWTCMLQRNANCHVTKSKTQLGLLCAKIFS